MFGPLGVLTVVVRPKGEENTASSCSVTRGVRWEAAGGSLTKMFSSIPRRGEQYLTMVIKHKVTKDAAVFEV